METNLLPCNPQANSMAIVDFALESGYVTKMERATDLPDEVDFLGKFRNGKGVGPWSKTPTQIAHLVAQRASTGEENAS